MTVSNLGLTIFVFLILIVLIVSFTNVLAVFPTYVCIIYETFILATAASNYNYVPDDLIKETRANLEKKPAFKPNSKSLRIGGTTEAQAQNRGSEFNCYVEYTFVAQMKVFGKEIRQEIPMRMDKKARGLKFYPNKPDYLY